MNVYVLIKYDDQGNPVLDMGGEKQYNTKPRMFRQKSMALNYAGKHQAFVIEVQIPPRPNRLDDLQAAWLN